MSEENNRNLIDDIFAYYQKCSDCTEVQYISDLRLIINGPRIISYIAAINVDNYSSKSWREAFAYITEEKTELEDREKIREALLKKIREK